MAMTRSCRPPDAGGKRYGTPFGAGRISDIGASSDGLE